MTKTHRIGPVVGQFNQFTKSKKEIKEERADLFLGNKNKEYHKQKEKKNPSLIKKNHKRFQVIPTTMTLISQFFFKHGLANLYPMRQK